MSSSARNLISIKNKYDRVVLLVDMDCFYCQVEEKLNPEWAGKPLAVVQYNAWRGGGIIAVNYAARARGVTRYMRGDEAKEHCPEVILAKVPNKSDKADLSKYRDAGKEVANVLQRFSGVLERASVDEAYLDITEAVNKRMEQLNAGSFVLQPSELQNTFAVGYSNIGEYIGEITKRFADPYANDEEYNCAYDVNDVPAVRKSDIRLLIGASICSEIRAAVKEATSYECSAGVAHNKLLAKLACGMNKPNKQTILPLSQIPLLFETLPVGKITGLGAKFGEEVCERLNVRYLGQLLKFTEAELQRKFDEKNGTWLYYLGRGIDLEAVTPRFYSKSIGCCKKFPGRNNITGLNTLTHWLNELACEISDRLEKDMAENSRRAKQMVVSFIQEFDGDEVSSSRSAPLTSYAQDIIAKNSLEIIKANTKQFYRTGSTSVLNNAIKFLSISVGKFETINNTQNKLQEMFANQVVKNQQKTKDENTPTAIDVDKTTQETNLIDAKSLDKKFNLLEKYLLHKEKDKTCNNQSTDINQQADIFDSTNISLQESNTESEIVAENTLAAESNASSANKSEESKSFFRKALKKQFIVDDRIIQSAQPQKPQEEDDNLAVLESEINSIVEEEAKTNITEELPKTKANSKHDEMKNSFFVNAMKKQNKTTDIDFVEKQDDNSNNKNAIQANKSVKRKHSESTENLTTCDDYQSSYAEFAVPELQPEFLQFTTCTICKAKIPSDERSVQTHQDHHFAQTLSQQQRVEYREEIKIKVNKSTITTPTSTKKKPKKQPDNTTVQTNKADITKFLKSQPQPNLSKPLEASTHSATVVVTQQQNDLLICSQQQNDLLICSDCKVAVKACDMDEHKDFHIAKDLQRKLNQLEVRTVTVVKKPSSSNQRKNLNSSLLNVTTKSIPSKPINEFFTQPNC